MTIEKITNLEELNKKIIHSDRAAIIEFGAEWCGTCQMLSQVITSQLEIHNGKICFFHVDFENAKDIVDELGVSYLPTYILFRKGEVVDHFTGAISRRSIAIKFNKLLANKNSN